VPLGFPVCFRYFNDLNVYKAIQRHKQLSSLMSIANPNAAKYLYTCPPKYLITDQPTTCPTCGTRTNVIADFLHTIQQLSIQECLNTQCKHVFFEVEDE
jgi:hypothetical protein